MLNNLSLYFYISCYLDLNHYLALDFSALCFGGLNGGGSKFNVL